MHNIPFQPTARQASTLREQANARMTEALDRIEAALNGQDDGPPLDTPYLEDIRRRVLALAKSVPALALVRVTGEPEEACGDDHATPAPPRPSPLPSAEEVEAFCEAFWPSWKNPALRTEEDRQRVRDAFVASRRPRLVSYEPAPQEIQHG